MISVGLIRSMFIGTGVLLLVLNLSFYVRKKIYEDLALIWVVAAVLEIIVGVLPFWDVKIGVVGIKIFIPLTAVMSLATIILYVVSAWMSVLRKKNQELAMQVSLLNQENEMILHRLDQLEGAYEKEDSLCN
ncbi:MAG: hypothetical protein K5675_03715 [Lachnospiraceae bacterium]|nr:hypothetical protein [Lachnospiraceae bacterium]